MGPEGYINMCRTFYPLMAERGGGMIVNIAGIGAIVKSPAPICIAAGNAAIIVMSQTLGSASHRDNIRATEYPNAGFDAGLSEARRNGWDIHEVSSGHDVMIDAPTQLAEILDGMA